MKSSFICIEIQSNAVTPHDNEPKQIRPSIGLRYRSIEFCFILFLSLFSLIEISMEFPNWQSTGWWLSLLLSLYLFLSVSVSLVLSSSYIPQKCHTLFCAHNHFSCISRVIQGQIYPRIVNSTNLDLGLTLSHSFHQTMTKGIRYYVHKNIIANNLVCLGANALPRLQFCLIEFYVAVVDWAEYFGVLLILQHYSSSELLY